MLANMLFTWLSYYGGVGLDAIHKLVYVSLDAIQEMGIVDGSA